VKRGVLESFSLGEGKRGFEEVEKHLFEEMKKRVWDRKSGTVVVKE